MINFTEQDFLKEIRFDIEVRDSLKAKIVLSYIENVSEKTQRQALFELSRADDDFAIPLLAGVMSNNPDVSEIFPQLKETLISKALDNPKDIVALLLKAEDSRVKGVLAEVVGEIRLQKAVPALIDLLNQEKDPDVIKSAIIALGSIGDPSAVNAINEYLYAGNQDLIVAAARALGELATPASVERLAARLGRDEDLDHMILDILAKIQIPEAVEKLNQTLASESAQLRTAGKQKLGEIGAMSVRVLIKNLLHDNVDLVIHSLNVLGDIGDGAAIPAIRKLLFNEPKDPNVRFAAYETLGRLPLESGAFALAAGLEDPVDNVRTAAAKAIDKNFNSALSAGVRNLTRTADPEALTIVATIINAQCDNLFMSLLKEDTLVTPAVNYLAKKAHPDIKAHFASMLSGNGHEDIAQKIISGKKTVTAKAGRLIFAVDDSTMILNIYRTVLHNLGFESELFEYPAEALKKIETVKPDVILTDLNMPGITGIGLTEMTRKLYKKKELPIIMVTTQDEAKDNKAALKAGVNGIINKPFTEGQIKTALAEYAGIKPA